MPSAHHRHCYRRIVWDSFAQSTMGVGTPSHAKLVSKLDALVDEPSIKRVYHVNFSEHPPLSCIEAPVTVIAIAVLKDIQYLDAWRRAGESARSNLSAAFPGKLLKSAHGSPLEDVQTMVYFAGWESIEVCVSVARLLRCPFDNLTGERRHRRIWGLVRKSAIRKLSRKLRNTFRTSKNYISIMSISNGMVDMCYSRDIVQFNLSIQRLVQIPKLQYRRALVI